MYDREQRGSSNTSVTLVRVVLAIIFCMTWITNGHAKDQPRVQVIETIIQLRSGPGDTYPVVNVVARGDSVKILKRRTSWYKVETSRGKQGWVHKDRFQHTLDNVGISRTVRDVLFEDYLHQRAEFGFVWGQFENNPFIAVHGGWRMSPNYSLELGYTQVSGTFSSSKLTNLNLMSHPFPERHISPYFALGFGRYRNEPIRTLIDAPTTSAWTANVTLGARAYLTQNFVFRVYARRYAAFISDDSTRTFTEWALGTGFFF